MARTLRMFCGNISYMFFLGLSIPDPVKVRYQVTEIQSSLRELSCDQHEHKNHQQPQEAKILTGSGLLSAQG